MSDFGAGGNYEIMKQELELANDRDTIIIETSRLEIHRIQHSMDKHKFEIIKAEQRMENRNKEITWLTSKLHG